MGILDISFQKSINDYANFLYIQLELEFVRLSEYSKRYDFLSDSESFSIKKMLEE